MSAALYVKASSTASKSPANRYNVRVEGSDIEVEI
jgi:hypothetical protein